MPGAAPNHTGSAPSPGGSGRGRGGRREAEKELELLTRMRYSNSLPDIPFDPKFIHCPFIDLNRFVPYKTTSLERNYKHELLTEPDLGVKIDLINPETYATDVRQLSEAHIDPVEKELLEDDDEKKKDLKRSVQHNKVVPWMRKTEYISSEYNRYGTQTERQETKVGYNIKKQFKEENIYRNRDSQLQAINNTFHCASQMVGAHYAKKGVHAVGEYPVFPDFDLWKYPFAQVIFDSDPAPANVDAAVQNEKMSQALIRGMMDESGEQFVAYFLPTDETLDKRRRELDKEKEDKEKAGEEGVGEEEEEKNQDYKLAREYNWTVKNKASKGYEENYLFVFRQGSVTYNELETRVRLSRRRAKEGQPRIANSRLIVTERELNEEEIAAQEERLLQLAPPGEEEEEEEEREEEGEEKAKSDAGSGDGENTAAEEDSQDSQDPASDKVGKVVLKEEKEKEKEKESSPPPAKKPRASSSSSSDSD